MVFKVLRLVLAVDDIAYIYIERERDCREIEGGGIIRNHIWGKEETFEFNFKRIKKWVLLLLFKAAG
jgi:hypothetical protein